MGLEEEMKSSKTGEADFILPGQKKRSLNIIKEMVSCELGKDIEEDVFRFVTSDGRRKTSDSSRGIEPQTVGSRAPMLYHFEKSNFLLENMFFVLSRAREEEKLLIPHEESNLRPSDPALRCSTTEPQRLNGVRDLLRSSYVMRPAYC